ncbi:rRNA pseudouridine synthase [candidate division WWE3 bacterium]|uniref:Pseudouridine synthase n=1 Tax=candidate division WWE3 bacterium TaxID=2053526 RepID=A0A955EBC4_UNCKA|nr:rRNA pseudouridine synthase [candidate division WWE3 bacterium]
MIRLNKYLAQKNIGSRRTIDEMIKNGKVEVNGNIVSLGATIDSQKDTVKINNQIINNINISYEYYILNKPTNVISAAADTRNNKLVTHLVPSKNRLYPVGRLDKMSTGLILLTNDGELANILTHPKFHLPKTYIVTTNENITPEQLETIRMGGIRIENKKTSKTIIIKLGPNKFKITLFEGIKRQIRESCKHVGLTVKKLHRIQMGEIILGNIKEGSYRQLSKNELIYLRSLKETTHN